MRGTSIGVALIGYGFAGQTFHAPLIRAVPGLDLRVISSSRHVPDVRVVSSPREAIESDVELVVIAAPNDQHFALAEAGLRAGKAVVVDKPFTLTLGEARALSSLAEERGLLLSVFHNRRWDSDFLAVKAAINNGLVGEVVHFESHFDRYRPAVRDRWRERSAPGGGVWFDLGPHLVDQALQLFGMPERVVASLAAQRPGAEIDDWAHVVLEYGRMRAVLQCTMLAASGSPSFIVHGTEGSVVKRGMDVQESQLREGKMPGSDGWGIDPDPVLIYDRNGGTSTIAAPWGDYRAYYAAVRDALRGEGPNPVPPEEACAVMAVLEAAVASATSH